MGQGLWSRVDRIPRRDVADSAGPSCCTKKAAIRSNTPLGPMDPKPGAADSATPLVSY